MEGDHAASALKHRRNGRFGFGTEVPKHHPEGTAGFFGFASE
jgi:hypothetical protein